MLLADTMAIFFVIVGLLITFPSLWLLCLALWPEFVQANTEAVEKGLLKSFLVGIPVTLLAILITVLIGKLPASFGQIGGILTFSFLMVFAQSGVAGLATRIGRSLKSPAALDRPWKSTLHGGIVLVLSYLLPLVGWFLILPASIIIGAGSSMRTLCGGKKRRRSAAESSAALAQQQIVYSSGPLSNNLQDHSALTDESSKHKAETSDLETPANKT